MPKQKMWINTSLKDGPFITFDKILTKMSRGIMDFRIITGVFGFAS
jgi:hypothetical protein